MNKDNNIPDNNQDAGQEQDISEQEIMAIIDSIDVTDEAEASREKIFRSISERIVLEPVQKKSASFAKRYWLSIAASFLVLSGLGYYLYQLGFISGSDEPLISYVEITSPGDRISEVILPDSSKVILNTNSRIRYPSQFSDSIRSVELDGEAFFDVARDVAKPFVINTRGMEVEVLGTRFNLKSFNEDNQVCLTLQQGAVVARINTAENTGEILLAPNDQVVLDKATGETSTRKVDTAIYTSWFTGDMYFVDNTLEDIARQLEKKYGVTITIAGDKIKQETFYCQFGRDESLERILQLLSQKSKWRYKIIGDKVEIHI